DRPRRSERVYPAGCGAREDGTGTAAACGAEPSLARTPRGAGSERHRRVEVRGDGEPARRAGRNRAEPVAPSEDRTARPVARKRRPATAAGDTTPRGGR